MDLHCWVGVVHIYVRNSSETSERAPPTPTPIRIGQEGKGNLGLGVAQCVVSSCYQVSDAKIKKYEYIIQSLDCRLSGSCFRPAFHLGDTLAALGTVGAPWTLFEPRHTADETTPLLFYGVFTRSAVSQNMNAKFTVVVHKLKYLYSFGYQYILQVYYRLMFINAGKQPLYLHRSELAMRAYAYVQHFPNSPASGSPQ